MNLDKTHVSEKDFIVFLCRFETTILAANCMKFQTNVINSTDLTILDVNYEQNTDGQPPNRDRINHLMNHKTKTKTTEKETVAIREIIEN